jgi:hypothetical protein
MTLTEAFSELPDPRTGPAQRHDLTEMILMALCAVLCSADSWVDVAEWAEDNEAWLKRYLVLEHGTPSHDTFGRVFRLLDAKVFETCFREWIGSLVGAVAGVVAIDGKTACGSKDGHNTALHTISAYATASGLCLGQEHTITNAIQTARHNSTEVASQANVGVTGVAHTSVGVHCGGAELELEQSLQAVAQIFRALEADARTSLVTRSDFALAITLDRSAIITRAGNITHDVGESCVENLSHFETELPPKFRLPRVT